MSAEHKRLNKMGYEFLLALALILLFTKLFGLMTAKVHLPQVVGALIAGVLLGPSCLGILKQTDFLTNTAEIGVIMLMFLAGIDTDMKELKETGPAACLIACLGVAVPILGCGGVYLAFFSHSHFDFSTLMRAAFIGIVFAATSVSITVEALNEMGKLKTKVGSTLLSAAIIDDIIGIVVLSVLTGIAGSGKGKSAVELKIAGKTLFSFKVSASLEPLIVAVKILLFFVFTLVVGLVVYRIFKNISINHAHTRRLSVWALAFCFIMAYLAEKLFGVADITGAYFAGVILCNLTDMRKYVAKKVTAASYLVFTPVFFAGIGLKTNLSGLNLKILLFALALFAAAVLTKIIGCSVGAKICKMNNKDSLCVGVGMVARGEVALMVAQKGMDAGYIPPDILPAIVFCVICAALITPVLLKLSFGKDKPSDDDCSEQPDGIDTADAF